MSAPLRILAFVAVLAVVFAGAALAGGAIGPEPQEDEPRGRGGEEEHGGDAAHRAAPARAVRGLAVAEGGLRLVVDDADLRPGREEELRFRVVGDDGATVRDFEVEHEKRMHLIVARRDLTGFQHLHPRQDADGSWRARLRIDDPGSYRVFADLVHRGRATTLAGDLRVDGPTDLRELPAPAVVATSTGGHRVTLASGAARPGEEAELRFAVTRDGRAVRPEPYLGACGHLVALREGDLAFLHVHPETHGGGDEIAFAATFPTAGRYRLFLQFREAGRVHTVAFTKEVPAS